MVHTHQLCREVGTTTPPVSQDFAGSSEILQKLYSCTTESILTGGIIAWYGKALQRVVHTAHYITGAERPAIQDLYIRHKTLSFYPQAKTAK